MVRENASIHVMRQRVCGVLGSMVGRSPSLARHVHTDAGNELGNHVRAECRMHMSQCAAMTLSASLAFAVSAPSAMGALQCIAGLRGDGQGCLSVCELVFHVANVMLPTYNTPARRSISNCEKLIGETPRLGKCFIQIKLLVQQPP